jgi:predicted anti-sigma-YlaC factor YlaD
MSTKTIDCEQALRLLAVHLDGELAAAQQHEVEQHLERCRSCYSRAEFERRLKSQLGQLRRGGVEPALQTRIQGLLDGFAAGS